MNSESIEVLESMKEILLRDGWRQHGTGGRADRSPVCLIGAYVRLSGTCPQVDENTTLPGLRELTTIVGTKWITHFNDLKGRTLNDVIDAIDDAIILAKEPK